MIKVHIFNKSNNISRVYDFKKSFQCIDSEMSLTHCTEMSVVCQKMLNSRRRLATISIKCHNIITFARSLQSLALSAWKNAQIKLVQLAFGCTIISPLTYLFTPKVGGYVSTCVCFSVCPLIYSKSYEQIFTKFFERRSVARGPVNQILLAIQITIGIQEF